MLAELLRRLAADDGGQDVAEYALMLAVIAVVVVGTLVLIGQNANNIFNLVATTLGNALTGGGS
jgi:Flp pilus assembly pilin Flp